MPGLTRLCSSVDEPEQKQQRLRRWLPLRSLVAAEERYPVLMYLRLQIGLDLSFLARWLKDCPEGYKAIVAKSVLIRWTHLKPGQLWQTICLFVETKMFLEARMFAPASGSISGADGTFGVAVPVDENVPVTWTVDVARRAPAA